MKKNNSKLSNHESEKLNELCGKTVKIVFFDNYVKNGVLQKDTLLTKYKCENFDNKNVIGYYLTGSWGELHFKKTHVKSIKEV